MIKIVNSVEKELGLTDFVVGNLSSRLGLLEFNDYQISKKKAKDYTGQEIDYTVFAVKCTNHFNNKQVVVNVDYETKNKVVLDEMKRKTKENIFDKVFLDFADVVIGHYVNGSGNFAQLSQTYKASIVEHVDHKKAEEIMRELNSQKPVDPVTQMKQEQQKK